MMIDEGDTSLMCKPQTLPARPAKTSAKTTTTTSMKPAFKEPQVSQASHASSGIKQGPIIARTALTSTAKIPRVTVPCFD